MQYDVKTPEEYIEQLPQDWRLVKIGELRKIIKDKAPKLTEKIEYKMLAYGNEYNTVFHLNAQKNYVSLYVGDISKIDPDGEFIEGLNIGKGCVRFTKSIQIPDTKINDFIERTIMLWEQGKDIEC
jgi:uncharacterized protein YdhG (YjbR/CyaY superfamily)